MSVEDDEDRLAFLDVDEFGKMVLVGPSSAELQGILIRKFVTSGDFAGVRPVFHCREMDVTALSLDEGQNLVDGSNTYKMRVFQKDGADMMDIVLEGPM